METAEPVISYSSADDHVLRRATIRGVEALCGRRELVRAYRTFRREYRPGDDIWAAALRELDIEVRFRAERLAAVPMGGPLVVVANHPYGIIDGLALCHLVAMVRQDFKVLAMSTLCEVAEATPHILPIDFTGTRQATLTSARSRRAARALLADGGCLIVFPAGAVSTARRVVGPAADGAWHPFVGRLVIEHRASVLPVLFEGQNSLLFQIASLFSQTIRLALLLREAMRRRGSEIAAHLGEVLPFERLWRFDDPRTLTDHLRSHTYCLGLPAPS